MATVTDEDLLELVERFDIPLEDTVDIAKLQAALAEKLAAAGVPYVSEAFLERFLHGIELKYEILPEIEISFAAYHRPSTRTYPGGYWQPVYRDVGTGQFISKVTVLERLTGLG